MQADSWVQGGADWQATATFYKNVFGCKTAKESVVRTLRALEAAGEERAIILVSHNGPSGLGSNSHDICGVDFKLPNCEGPPSGDWGDPDLQEALETFQTKNRYVLPCMREVYVEP
jgi:uncharacterized protein (TIGR04168 family)